jgi:hypothetical protein
MNHSLVTNCETLQQSSFKVVYSFNYTHVTRVQINVSSRRPWFSFTFPNVYLTNPSNA